MTAARRTTTKQTSERDDTWYAKGLRFQCTQCGNCCTGPPGYVWFDDAEGDAMASTLGLSRPDFEHHFARRVNGRWSLREHRTTHGFDCIFLDRQSQPGKALCRVYEARPAQCETWPFWPDNLQSPDAWQAARHLTPCPGMDRGPVVPPEEIRIRRDATPQ